MHVHPKLPDYPFPSSLPLATTEVITSNSKAWRIFIQVSEGLCLHGYFVVHLNSWEFGIFSCFWYYYSKSVRTAVSFPGGSSDEGPACQFGHIRDVGWIPGSGRCPGEGNGNPLQYSSLENSTARGAWWTVAHRVTKSHARLKAT